MVFIADAIGNPLVELGPIKSLALPKRIKNSVDVLPGLLDLRRWYDTKWSRSILCLVMAADEVSAVVALPEGQIAKVWPMRIDFATVRQPSWHLLAASAAIYFAGFTHRYSLLSLDTVPASAVLPSPKGGSRRPQFAVAHFIILMQVLSEWWLACSPHRLSGSSPLLLRCVLRDLLYNQQ